MMIRPLRSTIVTISVIVRTIPIVVGRGGPLAVISLPVIPTPLVSIATMPSSLLVIPVEALVVPWIHDRRRGERLLLQLDKLNVLFRVPVGEFPLAFHQESTLLLRQLHFFIGYSRKIFGTYVNVSATNPTKTELVRRSN